MGVFFTPWKEYGVPPKVPTAGGALPWQRPDEDGEGYRSTEHSGFFAREGAKKSTPTFLSLLIHALNKPVKGFLTFCSALENSRILKNLGENDPHLITKDGVHIFLIYGRILCTE